MSEKENIDNLFSHYIAPHLKEIESLCRKPAWKNILHPWLKGIRESRNKSLIYSPLNPNSQVWAGQIQIIDQILGLATVVDELLRAKNHTPVPEPVPDWELAQGADDLRPEDDLDPNL